MANARYIRSTDTAKLLRAALKAAFPGVKFSVLTRKYSGGASIDIGWAGGPARSEVEAVSEPFSSHGFDGMIDLQYDKDSWLMPDGTITRAAIHGTTGSSGVVPSEEFPAPGAGAELVCFGAGYISCNRRTGY